MAPKLPGYFIGFLQFVQANPEILNETKPQLLHPTPFAVKTG